MTALSRCAHEEFFRLTTTWLAGRLFWALSSFVLMGRGEESGGVTGHPLPTSARSRRLILTAFLLSGD